MKYREEIRENKEVGNHSEKMLVTTIIIILVAYWANFVLFRAF